MSLGVDVPTIKEVWYPTKERILMIKKTKNPKHSKNPEVSYKKETKTTYKKKKNYKTTYKKEEPKTDLQKIKEKPKKRGKGWRKVFLRKE
jgi:hypothetical protein